MAAAGDGKGLGRPSYFKTGAIGVKWLYRYSVSSLDGRQEAIRALDSESECLPTAVMLLIRNTRQASHVAEW